MVTLLLLEYQYKVFSLARYQVGLDRVVGDAVQWHEVNQISYLNAQTKFSDCGKVSKVVVTEKAENASAFCRNAVGKAVEIGPDLGWKNRGERGPLGKLSPFKVSTSQPSSSLLLSQMRETNRILQGCRLQQVRSAQVGAGAQVVTVQTSPQGVGTLVVFDHSMERNVYHAIHMDPVLACFYLASRDAISLPVYGVARTLEWTHHTGAELLFGILRNRLVSVERNRTFLREHAFRSVISVVAPLGLPFPLWDSFKFEPHRVASPFGTQFSAFMRWSFFGNSAIPRTDVLVVQRGKRRRLVGAKSGSFAEVVDAMCRRGLRVVPIEFTSKQPIVDVMRALARTAVFVGVHGAGLSHASWIPPESVMIEITLRRNFNISGPNTMYHKSDFANMARYYGLDYNYYDPLHVLPVGSALASKTVVVDAEKLANVVACAYSRFASNMANR